MDIFKIFDPIPHPVIAARGDTIEYKNAAAEALFSGDEHNRVSAVIPADYLRFDQEHFVRGFVLNGEDTSLLVSTVEGLRVYTLLTNGPSEDAILADALSNLCTALSDTVSSLKLAAGKAAAPGHGRPGRKNLGLRRYSLPRLLSAAAPVRQFGRRVRQSELLSGRPHRILIWRICAASARRPPPI